MKIPLKSGVIAAVKNDLFDKALSSRVEWVFDLSPDISTIKSRAALAHANDKRYFIHFDLADGVGKDRSGILYAKGLGIDGIISTRVNIIKLAREVGLFTVQRFFIVDSHSIDTTLDGIKAAKPDMIEIMPGTVSKVIKKLSPEVAVPIIAGGLIEGQDEVSLALESGASAVSTSRIDLW